MESGVSGYLSSDEYVSDVHLPNEDLSLGLDARGQTVWAKETGEFGEHYVVRFRIVPAAGGS